MQCGLDISKPPNPRRSLGESAYRSIDLQPSLSHQSLLMSAEFCVRLAHRKLPIRSTGLVQQVRCLHNSTSLWSGHSRWATIKHDKGKNDAVKNKQRSIFAQEIATASKRTSNLPSSSCSRLTQHSLRPGPKCQSPTSGPHHESKEVRLRKGLDRVSHCPRSGQVSNGCEPRSGHSGRPVSYTHLTLPTKRIV